MLLPRTRAWLLIRLRRQARVLDTFKGKGVLGVEWRGGALNLEEAELGPALFCHQLAV